MRRALYRGGVPAAYGIDLTTAKLHWFRFRALFAALPEDTLMAKIINWRTLDLADYEGSMREHYTALKERFALPAALRGGAAVAQTVAEHDAAFLARFRAEPGAGALPLLRQALPVWRCARPRHPACGSNAKIPPANGR